MITPARSSYLADLELSSLTDIGIGVVGRSKEVGEGLQIHGLRYWVQGSSKDILLERMQGRRLRKVWSSMQNALCPLENRAFERDERERKRKQRETEAVSNLKGRS